MQKYCKTYGKIIKVNKFQTRKTQKKIWIHNHFLMIFHFMLCPYFCNIWSAELQMNELIVCLWPKSQHNSNYSKYLSKFYIFCLHLLKLCNLLESNQMDLRAGLPESHLKVTRESFESQLNVLWESHESSESHVRVIWESLWESILVTMSHQLGLIL